jgi:hypothetical protein
MKQGGTADFIRGVARNFLRGMPASGENPGHPRGYPLELQ